MTGSIYAGPTVLCSGGVLAESVGIEVLGGTMRVLLEAGSELPVERSEIFSTGSDHQPSISVRMLAGSESTVTRSLGGFDVSGYAPRFRGIPHIEITFRVDTEARLIIVASENGQSLGVSWQR